MNHRTFDFTTVITIVTMTQHGMKDHWTITMVTLTHGMKDRRSLRLSFSSSVASLAARRSLRLSFSCSSVASLLLLELVPLFRTNNSMSKKFLLLPRVVAVAAKACYPAMR
eukprot:scaffold103023_cov55-Attheya_sp.AAC.1